jgi:chloramphenicol-sensitive protein RarD
MRSAGDSLAPAPPGGKSVDRETAVGIVYSLGAYLAWGVLPIYWKALDGVDAVEVVAHRVLWSVVFLVGVLLVMRRLPELRGVLRSPRVVGVLAVTTVLISCNWGIFIWSIHAGRLLEASLGYYMNPLVNVALGFLVLRERLRPLQWVAVALAAIGVVQLTVSLGAAPWIALTLAFSFALYGLLRKVGRAAPLVGLTVETGICAPFALAWLGWGMHTGTASFGASGWGTDVLLVLAGVATSLPLVWFAAGARRLSLATLGLVQYLAPSLQFLLAVFAFGEPVTAPHAVAFGCIWVALVLYTVEARRGHVGRTAKVIVPGGVGSEVDPRPDSPRT